jgi:hypothetical protein
MTYQPEKQKNTVLINVATKASAAPVGSFTLDKLLKILSRLKRLSSLRALPRKSLSACQFRFVPIPDINATHVTRSAARRNPSQGLTNTVGIGGHPLRPEQA